MIIWLVPFMWRFTLLWACWLLFSDAKNEWAVLFLLLWTVSFLRLVFFLPSALLGVKAEFNAADRRACKLLLDWLPWREKVRFYLCAKIRVKGSNGRRYSISPRRMSAVRWRYALFCGVPGRAFTPVFDDMLAQYLVLQNDANYFHERALGGF